MYGSIFNPSSIQGYGSPQHFGAYGVDPRQAGWDLNAAYLTPSIMAGYRPQYSGDQNFPMPYMGFGRGMMTGLPTPIQPESPFYINPLQYREQGIQSAASAGADATMTAVQLLGGAAVGLAVSSAMTAKSLSMPVNGAWSGVRRAVGASHMGSVFEAAGGGAGGFVGRVAGGFMGGALSKIPGMGSMGAAASAGAGMGAGIGGFVGAAAGWGFANIALPMIIAEGVDRTVFSTYTGIRRSQDSLREAFRGFAGVGSGMSPLTPNNYFTQETGSQLTRAFSADLGFKPGAGAEIFQYAQQAGLYRNIQINPGQITEKTKQIASQLKMVMDVFNEPSMQDAINTISKLQFVGGAGRAGISQIGAAYRITGAMTGEPTQKLMDTIGTQGQIMYGQSGVLPYLGQLASLNAYQGINYAYRKGLVSNQALAMMGGMEGATQSMVQVQAAMAQTPYNRMTAMLQEFYGGGRGQGGINATLGEYGQLVASNPMIASGQMAMYGDRAVSAQLSKNPYAMFSQMIQELKMIPGATDASGKVRFEALAASMHAKGFDSAAINAFAAQRMAMSDPGYMGRVGESIRAGLHEQYASTLEREGLSYNGVIHMEHAIKSAGAGIQTAATDYLMDPLTRVWNTGTDMIKAVAMPSTLVEEGAAIEGMGAGLSYLAGKYESGTAGAKAAGYGILSPIYGAASALSGIFESDNLGYRSNLDTLSRAIKSDPKTEAEIKAIYEKAKSGKPLSFREKAKVKAITGASSVEAGISNIGDAFTKDAITSKTDISSKNFTRAQFEERAREDFIKVMTSGIDKESFLGALEAKSLAKRAEGLDVEAMGRIAGYTYGLSGDELAAAIEEKGDMAAVAKLAGKDVSDMTADDVEQVASWVNRFVAEKQTGVASVRLSQGDSLETAITSTRGMANYESNARLAEASLAANQERAAMAMSGNYAMVAELNKEATLKDVTTPEAGIGDFTELNSAALSLNTASAQLVEASRNMNSYFGNGDRRGFRQQTASTGD